jgi:hypothetical protein
MLLRVILASLDRFLRPLRKPIRFSTDHRRNTRLKGTEISAPSFASVYPSLQPFETVFFSRITRLDTKGSGSLSLSGVAHPYFSFRIAVTRWLYPYLPQLYFGIGGNPLCWLMKRGLDSPEERTGHGQGRSPRCEPARRSTPRRAAMKVSLDEAGISWATIRIFEICRQAT